MRTWCAVLLCFLLAICPMLLTGCDSADEAKKTHVTVSVWDESVLTSGFASYINEQNPDYDIEWIVGEDSLDFYSYQAENGSLPDVILAKDFNEADASSLSESLYDLTESDVAANYREDYLRAIPANADKVTYLPAASGFEGILINEYLFNMYNIPVPTDRESFMQACAAFSETESRGFVAGLGDSETCYEVIQGFADEQVVSEAETFFTSVLQMGSSTVDVDNSAFDDALEFVNSLVDQKVIEESDLSLSPADAEQMFIDGKAAMLFVSNGKASTFGNQHNMTVRAIPFFGESDSWAFVEPAFIGAVSDVQSEGVTNTASNEEMHAAAIDVLSSIMSEEAQAKYFELTGMDLLVPTESDAQVSIPDALSTLTSSIEQESIRVYLPTEEVAKAVGTTLREVADGSLEAQGAAAEVSSLLKENQPSSVASVVATFSEGVSNRFDDAEGNVAASDIAQAAATQLKCDFFMVSPYAARCPLYAGDKTEDELAYSVAEFKVHTTKLTGAQIEELLGKAVSSAGSAYELPVVSGLHIVVDQTDDGFTLKSVERILATGESSQGTGSSEGRLVTEALDADSEYAIGLSCSANSALIQAVQDYSFNEQSGTLQQTWIKAFTDGTLTNIPAYQDYFEFAE